MRDRRGFRRLFRLPVRNPAEVEHEVDEEIRSHLEQRVESLVAEGLSPEAARAEAERRFGSLGGGLERARQRLHVEAAARERLTIRRERLDALRLDLTFAVRQMRRSPGHTAMVVLVLALGIGASTAVFTVLNAVLLRPLPFPAPERLAVIWSLDSLGNRAPASAASWRDWQAQSRAFERIALHYTGDMPVVLATPGAEAITTKVAMASENFFEVMRPRMRLGRAFSTEDATAGTRPLVVSERFWRGALGRAPRLPVALTIQGTSYEVVGVLRQGLEYPAEVDLWALAGFQRSRAPRNAVGLTATGRLAPGRTLAQADQELDAVMARVLEREPDAMYAHGVTVESLRENLTGNTAQSIRMVAAAGLLMLLIACANAAAASLVRSSARARELAIRASLGAGRGRILRQLVTEQLVLAMASGLLGLWLAHMGTRWLARAAGSGLPRMQEVGFDARVLAVAAACSILSAALAGLLPMMLVRRASLRGMLAAGRRAGGSAGGLRLGRVLVGAEVAVAVVLLAGSALLVESFRVLIARELGFDTRGVATVKLTLLPPRYTTDEQRLAYLRDLEQSVRSVPGVAATGLSSAPPLGEPFTGGVAVEGSGAGDLLVADYRLVSDGYYQAIGIPVLAGRAFDDRDVLGAPRVTLVNRTMAERYWPGESAVGKRLRALDMEGKNAPWLTVIGVVGDVRQRGYASEPRPEHYVPYRQIPGFAWGMTLVVRSGVPLDRVIPAVRASMQALDPTIPPELRPLDEQIGRSVSAWRLPMSIVSTFGMVALVLAALGVYTVFAFVVAQRSREIGVRIALGATSGAVLRGTLRDALEVTLAGAGAGSVVAYFLTGFARTLLFEGTPVDVRPLAGALVVLIATTALAAYIPGRRAARVDPTVALRSE